jgi:general secretion pathway protein I
MCANNRPRAPRHRARAFTMLEVLVALAILAVSLLAIYQAFSSTLFVNASTRGLWKAMVYANNELMRWERMPTVDVSVDQGTFPPGDPMEGYSWRREVKDIEPLPGIRVRKVELQVSWQLGTGTQSYRTQIYVTPR